MSRTTVTKHLHILASVGLISSQKIGHEKLYRLGAEPLQTLEQWLEFYEQFWEEKLSKLKSIVGNEGKAD